MKTFKEFKQALKEDGAVAVSAAPTNTTAGISGLKDPGVKMPKTKQSPVLTGTPIKRTGGC